VVRAVVLLGTELKHTLNAAAAGAVHNRMLILAHCCGRSAAVYNVSVI